MSIRTLVLASGSPRRRDLLTRQGYTFTVDPAGIEEIVAEGEDPVLATCRLAAEKAQAVADRRERGEVVLAADTSVICDGRMFGKPDSDQDACAQLASLVGRNHWVVTAWTLLGPGGAAISGLTRSTVRMREAGPREIRAYVARGESRDKAGSYALQGRGGSLVGAVLGCTDNVVGLPVAMLAAPLARLGVAPG